MKISIIIPTFNSSKTIESNIRSIVYQNFKNYEVIVVDNQSNDNTIKIIKNSSLMNVKFIIEKDFGVYDAINKGIKQSNGEVISLLHSDDIYYDEKVLSKVENAFSSNNTSIVYGDLVYVKKNNLSTILRYWRSNSFNSGNFLKGWHPPHPSFFVKKKLFNKFGFYKIDIGNAADVELMYRFLQLYKINSIHINSILVKMRYGGQSNKKLITIIKQNFQIVRFLGINHNYYKMFLFFMYKLTNRLKQFYARPKF